MQTVKAQLRFLKISPRKVRLLADTVRGLPVEEAEAKLLLSPRRPKEALLKLLRSAVANAKNNNKLVPETLFIKELRVDQGPMLKRWMPRSRGSIAGIQKKMSHVTIILGTSEKPYEKRFSIVVPKHEKKEEKKGEKKKTKAKGHEERAEEKTAAKEKEKEQKVTPENKPKETKGALRKVFRRKAI